MPNRTHVRVLKSLLVVLGAASVTGGCAFSRDEYDRIYRPWAVRERYPFDKRPPPRLRAPDLRSDDARVFVQGENVSIQVVYENAGDAAAGAFDVVARVDVPGSARQVFTIRVSGLAPGAARADFIGTVVVPLGIRPADVDIRVSVDPRPGGIGHGEVLEFVETNNNWAGTISIF